MPSDFRTVTDDFAMRVIANLRNGQMRSNELARRIRSPNAMHFTRLMKKMRRDGTVVRIVRDLGPPAIILYQLTDLGKTLVEPASAVVGWVDQHGGDVMVARDLHRAARALERAGTDDELMT